MRIHSYTAGAQSAVTHPDVAPDTRLGELITIETGELAYRVGHEAEIDVQLTIIEIFGTEPGHVIVHACREIAVTVSYAGTVRLLTARPWLPVSEVRAEAIAALELDPGSSADLVLRLPGSGAELTVTSPIGAYVPAGTCTLTLDLVHVVRPQG
jgi:hypothetical protein